MGVYLSYAFFLDFLDDQLLELLAQEAQDMADYGQNGRPIKISEAHDSSMNGIQYPNMNGKIPKYSLNYMWMTSIFQKSQCERHQWMASNATLPWAFWRMSFIFSPIRIMFLLKQANVLLCWIGNSEGILECSWTSQFFKKICSSIETETKSYPPKTSHEPRMKKTNNAQV